MEHFFPPNSGEDQNKRSLPEFEGKKGKRRLSLKRYISSGIRERGYSDQNKRSSPEMENFFFPNSSTDLRSDAHQSQIVGGDADEDHTQIVGGGYSQIIGGYIPPSPGVSAPLTE